MMTLVVRSIRKIMPEFQPPAVPPVWARLAGADLLREQMQQAGFREVQVVTSRGSLRIESPEAYWTTFTRSAPPLAYLFEQLGPERTAAVGREYIHTLRADALDGVPSLRAETCIGIGRA